MSIPVRRMRPVQPEPPSTGEPVDPSRVEPEPDASFGADLDPSDAELMARVRAGDRDAFGHLVARYGDDLVAYLARLTGSRERAEDLAQEAFLRLYRTVPRYRERGRLAALLYRIATNLLRSEERRDRRWRTLRPALDVHGERPAAPGAPQRLLQAELRRRLAAALAGLPLKLRAPLVLYEIEDWPQREIARALDCREGTVKSRLHRARARLREELGPLWNEWNGGTP
jgi:RNA polymerase sigma-70 factor (ECF subfamily)